MPHQNYDKPRTRGIGLAGLFPSESGGLTGRSEIGPAKRATRCIGGACWDPNRFGWCRTCGGDKPLEEI